LPGFGKYTSCQNKTHLKFKHIFMLLLSPKNQWLSIAAKSKH